MKTMNMPEEDALSEMKPEILVEKREILCQNLMPKDHYPYLRSRYVLSEDDQELIEAEVTRRHKVSKFLDVLLNAAFNSFGLYEDKWTINNGNLPRKRNDMKKGCQGFDELIKSIIEEKTQIYLAEELNKAYEDKVKRVKALLTNQDTINRNGFAVATTTFFAGENHSTPHINQSQYRHSYPKVGHLTSTNRDSISDLGVDKEKLPKPMKKKPILTDVTVENSVDVKPHPESLKFRENSVEEHEDKDSHA